MSNIVNNAESDTREVLQASSVKMQAYAMKIDLLSNATVIEKAVNFIDRHIGLTNQNNEVMMDNESKLATLYGRNSLNTTETKRG